MRRADVVKTWNEYNHLLFGGRLSEPDIMIRHMNDYARWYEPDADHPAGLLVMSSSKRHPFTWRATLLHECIHIAVPEDDADHGTAFLAEANRIGAIIGVEECEPGEAWSWPGHSLDGRLEEVDLLSE